MTALIPLIVLIAAGLALHIRRYRTGEHRNREERNLIIAYTVVCLLALTALLMRCSYQLGKEQAVQDSHITR